VSGAVDALSTNGATVNVELAYITAITSDDLATVSSGSKDLSPLQVNIILKIVLILY
jgi:hypothetical protein